MRGLVTLLLYALFFYLMMRFGCGAHMVHGHGHGHEGHGEGSAKDPVCGVSVEPGRGYTMNYQGRVRHFCSRKCLDSFEAEPQRYVA
jgi:YHS domain-containing protein